MHSDDDPHICCYYQNNNNKYEDNCSNVNNNYFLIPQIQAEMIETIKTQHDIPMEVFEKASSKIGTNIKPPNIPIQMQAGSTRLNK